MGGGERGVLGGATSRPPLSPPWVWAVRVVFGGGGRPVAIADGCVLWAAAAAAAAAAAVSAKGPVWITPVPIGRSILFAAWLAS